VQGVKKRQVLRQSKRTAQRKDGKSSRGKKERKQNWPLTKENFFHALTENQALEREEGGGE